MFWGLLQYSIIKLTYSVSGMLRQGRFNNDKYNRTPFISFHVSRSFLVSSQNVKGPVMSLTEDTAL